MAGSPVAAFDRLIAADPTSPEGWLRTPGLLRLATALVHQNRPRDGASLLAGGARRRAADGLLPAVLRVSFGVTTSTADGEVRVTELLSGYPAPRADLRPGDIILKVNDTELTRDSVEKLDQLLSGEAGTKVRLTVRHSGSEKPALIELSRERFVNDPATRELLDPLRVPINERLARTPRDAGLLVCTRRFARQWSDAKDQVTDFTADQDGSHEQRVVAPAADLKRLYGRRGNAYVALRQWQHALDDYAHAITPQTKDVELLSNRAQARRCKETGTPPRPTGRGLRTAILLGLNCLPSSHGELAACGQVPLAMGQYEKSRALYEQSLAADPENNVLATELAQLLFDEKDNENATRWTVLKPTEMKSKGGATLTLLHDGSILAGGVNPPSDEYTVAFLVPEKTEIRSIRLEALTDVSLPGHGPGRGQRNGPAGLFELRRWDLTAKRPDRADSARTLSFRAAAADHSMNHAPLGLHGEWNISWEGGKNHASVWSLSDPITLEAGTELRSQMRFNPYFDWSDQNLGRFRLSASGDPAAFGLEKGHGFPARLSPPIPWVSLAAAHTSNGRSNRGVAILHPCHRAGRRRRGAEADHRARGAL